MGDSRWYRQGGVQAAALFLLAFLLYGNTLGHDFTVDDAIVITDNALVQRGPAAIGEIFSHDTFYGFFEDDAKANLVAGGRYRPLTLALFAVEQAVAPGPFIGHLFNVIWYGALLVLVFFWASDFLAGRGFSRWLPLFVSALFAAHPVHTEVVANIKGRDEILALLGAVGASWLVWKAAQRKNWFCAAAGAVVLGLGCLAKETTFTFVAVIPAVLLLFPPGEQGAVASTARRIRWSGLKYTLPALLAAAAYLLVRSAVLPAADDRPILELMNNPFVEWTGTAWRELPTTTRLATGSHSLLYYLKLVFVPTGLVHDYYPNAIPLKTWSDVGPYLGLLIHAALALFALVKWRAHRLLSLGILLYLAGISVASNLAFPVGTLLSERFLFFPSLGWSLALAYGFDRLGRRAGTVAGYAGLALFLVFGTLTVLRNPDWKDNYTLFTTDVEKQPESAKLRNAAAGARVDRYQALPEPARAGQRDLLERAIADASVAVRIHPTYRNAFLIRGNANLLLERFDAAIADYDRTLEIDPNYQPATDNLAIALTAAGRHAGEVEGNVGKAFGYLHRAEQLRPMDYETLRLLGVAAGVSGDHARALGYFERAAAVRPNDADAQWNWGLALYNAGREAEAQEKFIRAQQIRPGIIEERRGG